MKRVCVLTALLLVAASSAAMTNAEIRCFLLGMGGETTDSTTHRLRSYLGATVVGVSTSASYELIHGPVPCPDNQVTAVDDPAHLPPREILLHQNAPNPFNPRTTITYELPRDVSHVGLRIYDRGGRLVRTLVDGPQSMGRQSVVWNGRDASGREVASGIYLYELDTPQRRLTRKMTLIK